MVLETDFNVQSQRALRSLSLPGVQTPDLGRCLDQSGQHVKHGGLSPGVSGSSPQILRIQFFGYLRHRFIARHEFQHQL